MNKKITISLAAFLIKPISADPLPSPEHQQPVMSWHQTVQQRMAFLTTHVQQNFLLFKNHRTVRRAVGLVQRPTTILGGAGTVLLVGYLTFVRGMKNPLSEDKAPAQAITTLGEQSVCVRIQGGPTTEELEEVVDRCPKAKNCAQSIHQIEQRKVECGEEEELLKAGLEDIGREKKALSFKEKILGLKILALFKVGSKKTTPREIPSEWVEALKNQPTQQSEASI